MEMYFHVATICLLMRTRSPNFLFLQDLSMMSLLFHDLDRAYELMLHFSDFKLVRMAVSLGNFFGLGNIIKRRKL